MRSLRVLRVIDGGGGWALLPIHYSHDPDKDEVWAARQRASYLSEADFEREMNLDITRASAPMAYWNYSRQLHVRNDLIYNPMLPLCLCCDFNVGLMVWEVAQIVQGVPRVIAEIAMEPGVVPSLVQEFRTRWPAHPGGVRVYGDASGNARSTHDAKSDYDLMRLAFRAYASPVEFRVPPANPGVRARLNSVNALLRSEDGDVRLLVADTCKELLADFEEVERDASSASQEIRKSSKPDDPYSRRTHASDALGYFIAREWPVVEQVDEAEPKKKKPAQPDYSRSALPGDMLL